MSERIYVSSRIRLARNLADQPFPSRLEDEAARRVAQRIREAMPTDGDRPYLALELATLDEANRASLAERHLMSWEMVRALHEGWLVIRRDEALGVMINEEDHLRIQALRPGFDLETAFAEATELAGRLEAALPLAWSPTYGYLTACPTNTGTGLRASVMLHLAGLSRAQAIPRLHTSLARSGFTLRGAFGEGSEAEGHLYQVSNQVTLGRDSREIVDDLADVVRQIGDSENRTRRRQYEEETLATEDRIGRSLGVLGNARRMAFREALNLLSDLREGIDLGLLPEDGWAALDRLMRRIGPASIQWQKGERLEATERDRLRAEMIRTTIKEYF